jgi:hypothetical protein
MAWCGVFGSDLGSDPMCLCHLMLVLFIAPKGHGGCRSWRRPAVGDLVVLLPQLSSCSVKGQQTNSGWRSFGASAVNSMVEV